MISASPALRRATAAGLAVAAGVALAACGSSGSKSSSGNPLNSSAPQGSVVVGSANFPEDELLAQIYSTALAAKGIKVTNKFNIGAREVYYPEVKNGTVTIMPEYNGALLTTSVDTKSTAATTDEVDAALRSSLPSTLEILNPSAAQDKDSVTVTQAFATAHNLKTIADLKPIAKKVVIGGPPEFKTRTDGLVGLRKNYGLNFKSFAPLDESGPITLKALTDGKVQAADVFTTTPQIITDKLVALGDPKFNFAAQNVVPLVNKKGVNSTIVDTLNAISAKLTTAALLQMDKAVIVDHADYTTVASGWLKAEGLPN
ncbi:MAG TPA: ABC transporter substrate-binding protein [Streptosporangiaceae bacterium]|jgi:osmoprotectant transport system substrate-binding protein